MTEQFAQIALAFLARDARPVGLQEAESLLKAAEWLKTMIPAPPQSNGVDKSAPTADQATEA